MSVWKLSYSGVLCYIENSQLYYTANHLSGFYVIQSDTSWTDFNLNHFGIVYVFNDFHILFICQLGNRFDFNYF